MIIESHRHGYSAEELLDSHDEGRQPELVWTWDEIVKHFGPRYELDFRDELKTHGHNGHGEALYCAGEVLGWLGY
jgi:hypothetical protein